MSTTNHYNSYVQSIIVTIITLIISTPRPEQTAHFKHTSTGVVKWTSNVRTSKVKCWGAPDGKHITFFTFFSENRIQHFIQMSPQETICMKYQTLFFWEKTRIIFQFVICWIVFPVLNNSKHKNQVPVSSVWDQFCFYFKNNYLLYYDDLVFYIPFNIIKVILRQWKDDNERVCSMKCCTIMKTCLFKYTENFTIKKWKFSDKKFRYFSYFCSKHRLWVLIRTASLRQF